jgi:hypothetical protein
LKNPSRKRVGGVAQGEDPEFKPQYLKKRKKMRNKFLLFNPPSLSRLRIILCSLSILKSKIKQ